MYSTGQWWMWLSFIVFIVVMITIDLCLLGKKKAHKVSTKEALSWIIAWVSLSLLFNLLFWWYLSENQELALANQKALEFLSGYLIELSLSVDNMFAFIMIFNYFKIPPEYQRRVLIFGVLSAIILRLVLILSGTWLVSELHWVLYLFGLFLVFTGIKMLFPQKEELNLDKNRLLIWLRQHIRITEKLEGEKFFITKNHFIYATPLFLVLVFIELSDVMFALDSIPAIFSITRDEFIIFTSNVFAILGLRSLYFLLSNMADKFHLLRYGIALMLTFVGIKMLIADWVHVPILVALSILIAILGTTIILSLAIRPKR
ncbi:TerC family protein [Gammaproteobacteria bacterium]|nr:TerC family protein [Gammaproteobacteria bacterium]